MTEVSFTIPDVPPGINKYMRMHFRTRKKLREDWTWQIKAAVSKQDVRTLRAWRDLGYRLSISMHVTNLQLFDGDNLSSLFKVPVDILCNLQILENDDPEHLEFEKPTQEVGKKSVRFTIRSVTPAA